jgi:hypothetical protein
MDTPLLWHIPLSHYSEKVRWALDYKGIAHRRSVLTDPCLARDGPGQAARSVARRPGHRRLHPHHCRT